MRIRFAKPLDARELASIHWKASRQQPGGFMHRLGKRYLYCYYKIFLRERNSVILCAEDENGKVVGLVAGTIDAEEHLAALKRTQFRLILAAIPALLKDIRLLSGLVSRIRSLWNNSVEHQYVVMSGPREEYWAWDPLRRSGEAFELQRRWLKVMKLFGATSITFEVDRVNVGVIRIHEILGACVIKKFVTPSGNERFLMQYSFENSRSRRQHG